MHRGEIADSFSELQSTSRVSLLWVIKKGSNVSSPVYHDGYLYWAHDETASSIAPTRKPASLCIRSACPLPGASTLPQRWPTASSTTSAAGAVRTSSRPVQNSSCWPTTSLPRIPAYSTAALQLPMAVSFCDRI